jgi:uncharacterized protein
MHTPCELAVKIALPCIRAMLADQLMDEHRLNQTEVSNILGITQSAVSKYQQKHRGCSITLDEDPEMVSLFAKHADTLANGNPSNVEKLGMMCEICSTIRSKGYLCRIHKTIDPIYDVENCYFCKTGVCWGDDFGTHQQEFKQPKVASMTL